VTQTERHTHSPLAGERLAAADLVVVVGRGREEERKNAHTMINVQVRL